MVRKKKSWYKLLVRKKKEELVLTFDVEVLLLGLRDVNVEGVGVLERLSAVQFQGVVDRLVRLLLENADILVGKNQIFIIELHKNYNQAYNFYKP